MEKEENQNNIYTDPNQETAGNENLDENLDNKKIKKYKT